MTVAVELSSHFRLRALVFEDLRVLYVPVPKASCTGLLWLLAQAAGLPRERFLDSSSGEVTTSLTIHDLSRWPNIRRFGMRRAEVQDRALHEEGWFRFTVVRDPFPRLWSAWQSKILLAEPQFLAKFSHEPWFPELPHTSQDVIDSYRRFVAGIAADPELARADVHWAPQAELMSFEQVKFTHVGRVENLRPTLDSLQSHLTYYGGFQLPPLPRTNRTPLRYLPQLYDESDAELLAKIYADDLAEFSYEPPATDALRAEIPDEWRRTTDALIPALHELRERNERVGGLRTNVRNAEEAFEELRERHRATKEQHKQTLDGVRAKNQELRTRNADQRVKIQNLSKTAAQRQRELQAMRNSVSWRYTAPLRRLRAVIGRLRRGGGSQER